MALRDLFFGTRNDQASSGCAHAQDSPCCRVPLRVLTNLVSGNAFYKCVNCGQRYGR